MKRIFNLGSEDLTPGGGPVPFSLAPIPDQYMSDSYRVARLVFTLTLQIDVTEGNDWEELDFADWLQNIYVRAAEKTLVNISGLDLWLLLLYAHGQSVSGNLGFEGVDGVVTDQIVTMTFEIPFENQEAFSPQDFVVPASLFNDAELIMSPGAAAPVTGVTVDSANVTVWAQVERKNEVQIAALPIIMGLTQNLFTQLQPGIYTELFARKTDKSAITTANFTSVLMRANGETIHGAINVNGLAACYGWDHAFVGTYYGSGDTVNEAFMLPLIWPAWAAGANRISQFIDTGRTPLDVEMQGDQATCAYVLRAYRPITAEGSAIQLGKMGAATPEALIGKRKTASKTVMPLEDLRNRSGLSIIPVKVQGAQTQAALGKLSSRFQPPFPGQTGVVRPR